MENNHRPIFLSLLRYVLIIAVGYLLLFAADVITAPTTTPAETARAHAYAKERGKELPPIAFYQDGCTAFPDWLPGHNFYEACLNHDIAYWLGGSEEERTLVNRALAEQVRPLGPLGPFLAPIMYTAVQYGGNSWISHELGSEWGYGWQ